MSDPEGSKPLKWGDRIIKDSERCPPEMKLRIGRAFLEHACGLNPEEAGLFLDESFIPTPQDPDRTLIYAGAEQKIHYYYTIEGVGVKPGSEEDMLTREKSKRFRQGFREAAQGFYTDEEFDSLFAYATLQDDPIMFQRMIGRTHFIVRRIRNAYLTGMTDVIRVTSKGAEDISGTLFDGPRDPVSEMNRILGISDNEG